MSFIKEPDPRTYMLAKLRDSGLTAADAKQLGYKPLTEKESAALKLPIQGAGFRIPYYTAKGRELPMYRFRFAIPKMGSSGKLLKYAQPEGSPPAVYLPRIAGINWETIQANPECPLIITEGELKAACATKVGRYCIGLGGVWNFASSKYEVELLPQLEEFVWKNRTVYIAYDSDSTYKQGVQQAANRLARVLSARGADVRMATIPGKVIDGEPVKVGLDDLIVVNGIAKVEELEPILETAADWTNQEELFKLNAEAAFIRNPHCIAIFPQADAAVQDRGKFSLKSIEQFIQQFAPRKVLIPNAQGIEVPKPAAKIWFESNLRREHHGIVYAPGQCEVVDNQLNMWPGWPHTPKVGSVAPWLGLLDKLFTDAEQAERHWFCQWLAWPIQQPGAKMNTACLLWSFTEGNGKSTVGHTMRRVYGSHNSSKPTQNDLDRDFNSWQENKQLICGEEITGNNSRQYVDKLKHLITSDTIMVNRKGIEAYEYPNKANIIFTSNHPNALHITEESRRYFVHEVKNSKMPTEWWPKYEKWLENECGAAHLMQWLMDYDTSDFKPHAPAPFTASREDMVIEGYTEVERWCHDMRSNPDDVLRSGTTVSPFSLFTTRDLIGLARGQNRFTEHDKTLNDKTLGHALRKFGYQQVNKNNAVIVNMTGGRARVWAIRNPEHAKMSSAAGEYYMQERAVGGAKFAATTTKKVGGKKK